MARTFIRDSGQGGHPEKIGVTAGTARIFSGWTGKTGTGKTGTGKTGTGKTGAFQPGFSKGSARRFSISGWKTIYSLSPSCTEVFVINKRLFGHFFPFCTSSRNLFEKWCTFARNNSEIQKCIPILGLLAIYCYSICLHAYNKSVFWELFFDRWGYQTKVVDRDRFKRKKARIISYGIWYAKNGRKNHKLQFSIFWVMFINCHPCRIGGAHTKPKYHVSYVWYASGRYYFRMAGRSICIISSGCGLSWLLYVHTFYNGI